MPIVWKIITGLFTNRLVRTIGLVLAGVLSFLTFGALNVRKGRLKERADAALRDARANAKEQKDINDAVEKSYAGGGSWRDRLRRHQAERDR